MPSSLQRDLRGEGVTVDHHHPLIRLKWFSRIWATKVYVMDSWKVICWSLSWTSWTSLCGCNEVRKYGKKEAGTGEHLTHFNNKINKHKWKAAAPHGRLPHTKHKLKSRPGPLSSSTVVTPHLTLPKLLRGTRDRWVVQVSFITNYSTGLAPFPRLSAPPHSSQWSWLKPKLKSECRVIVWILGAKLSNALGECTLLQHDTLGNMLLE